MHASDDNHSLNQLASNRDILGFTNMQPFSLVSNSRPFFLDSQFGSSFTNHNNKQLQSNSAFKPNNFSAFSPANSNHLPTNLASNTNQMEKHPKED